MTGQSQVTQYVPYSASPRSVPTAPCASFETKESFWTYFIGFKIDKAGIDDPLVRRAMVMAVDQESISKDINYGETEPAYSYVSQLAQDWDKAYDGKAHQDQWSPRPTSCSIRPAG